MDNFFKVFTYFQNVMITNLPTSFWSTNSRSCPFYICIQINSYYKIQLRIRPYPSMVSMVYHMILGVWSFDQFINLLTNSVQISFHQDKSNPLIMKEILRLWSNFVLKFTYLMSTQILHSFMLFSFFFQKEKDKRWKKWICLEWFVLGESFQHSNEHHFIFPMLS